METVLPKRSARGRAAASFQPPDRSCPRRGRHLLAQSPLVSPAGLRLPEAQVTQPCDSRVGVGTDGPAAFYLVCAS